MTRKTKSPLRGLAASALLLPIWLTPALAEDAPPAKAETVEETSDDATPHALTLSVDNDLFGSGKDGHYTQGMRMTWVPSTDWVPYWVQNAFHAVPWIDSRDRTTFTFALGQNMYTPDDISVADPDPDDRPYAGWLYVTAGTVVEDTRNNVLHNLAIDIGVVGPASLAEQTQRMWHDFINTTKPRGWDHQLHNEPGINLTYEVSLREPLTPVGGLGDWLEIDVTPKVGFALGNIFTYAAIGANLRVGNNLSLDYGPPFIRPSLPGSGMVKRRGEWGWYLFAGFEGRAVARNIFLDGNTFRDSPSVDKEPLILDFQAGLAVTTGRVRIAFTQILRGKEYKTQDDPDRYGSISVTYLF